MVNVANGSSIKHLSEQFKTLYNRIKKCIKIYTREGLANYLQHQCDLGIRNLHVIEIDLVILYPKQSLKVFSQFYGVYFPKRDNFTFHFCKGSLTIASAWKNLLKFWTCLWLSFLMAFYGNLSNIYKVTSIQKIEHPFKNQHLKKNW